VPFVFNFLKGELIGPPPQGEGRFAHNVMRLGGVLRPCRFLMHINMRTSDGWYAGYMSTTTLTDSQRAQLHGMLEQRKAQLLAELGEVQRDTLAAAAQQDGVEAPEDSVDKADRMAHNTVRDAEATRDHDELVAVRAALARWADGSLGECTDCGQPVGVARLLAQPSAARCIGCQSVAEQRALR